jgi:hypothetical protein
VLLGLAAGGPQSCVANAMQRDVQIVDPHDMLDAALGRREASKSDDADRTGRPSWACSRRPTSLNSSHSKPRWITRRRL